MSHGNSQSYMLSNSDHYKVYRSHKVEKKNTATVINPYVRLNTHPNTINNNNKDSKFYALFLENRVNIDNYLPYAVEEYYDDISLPYKVDRNIPIKSQPELSSSNKHVNKYINDVKSRKKQKQTIKHLGDKKQFLLINHESNGKSI